MRRPELPPARRVLVVDDDPVTVRLVEAVLRSDGHEVATSGTGIQVCGASSVR